MAYFLSMFGINRSRKQELKKFEVSEENIEKLIGPFEIAEALSGDIFCIPIIPQKEKQGLLNAIVSSILNQKIWGDCVQLSPEESLFIGKNRR